MTLGKIGAPIAVGTMRRALADGDQATQMWAIRGLGQLKDGESVALLIDRMRCEHVRTRICAATALGRIGDRQATPALTAALEDPNHRVGRAAAMALARLGDPRAVGPLRRAHDEATGFTRIRIGRALRDLARQRLRSPRPTRLRRPRIPR